MQQQAQPVSYSDDSNAHEEDGESTSPLGWVLIGLGCFAVAGFLYWYFTSFEAGEARSRKMWWVLAMLYNFGGKWLAVGVTGALGAFATSLGIYGFAKGKESL